MNCIVFSNKFSRLHSAKNIGVLKIFNEELGVKIGMNP